MTEPVLTSVWRHRFAILAAAATFPLVFLGGTVTSKDAGMAVPDWPLSFGSVNPPGWWQMDQVNVEHGHRLLGATVGLLVLIQALWTGFAERRQAMRTFAYFLLAGVVVQGIMGGLRVTHDSIGLALVHGCTAQLFFAAVVVFACVTSPKWAPIRVGAPAEEGYSPRLALATLAAMVVQLVLGAFVRHKGMTVAPHVVWSLVVLALVHASLARVLQSHRTLAWLRVPAVLAAVLVVVQMGLGVVAWAVTGVDGPAIAGFAQWAMPTLHVAMGALLIALAAVQTVAIFSVSETSLECPSPLPHAPMSAP